MGQVAVSLHGRLYRFDCGDGEEARFEELAAYLKGRIEMLARQYGNVGADRLMLAAALLITDELMDARAALAGQTTSEKASAEKAGSDKDSSEKTKPVAAAPRAEPAPINGQRSAAAEKREQEAIRAEFRRKLAAGGEA